MKTYGGRIFFIDRDNVNTDEIIPAKYLTYIEKEPLKNYLLEDLKMDGFNIEDIDWKDFAVIISKSNFGSGSSREMAVWAFEINDINLIIASNFARIFRENCFNCGILALELEDEEIVQIFDKFASKSTVNADVDVDKGELTISSGEDLEIFKFKINTLQKDLIKAGGWVELAQQKY